MKRTPHRALGAYRAARRLGRSPLFACRMALLMLRDGRTPAYEVHAVTTGGEPLLGSRVPAT